MTPKILAKQHWGADKTPKPITISVTIYTTINERKPIYNFIIFSHTYQGGERPGSRILPTKWPSASGRDAIRVRKDDEWARKPIKIEIVGCETARNWMGINLLANHWTNWKGQSSMHVYVHRIMHTHTHTLVLPEMREDEREMGKMLKLLAKQINNKDGECERIPAAGIEAKVLLILNQEAGGGFHAKKARYVAGIKVLSQSLPHCSPSLSPPSYPSLSVSPHCDYVCAAILIGNVIK